MSELSKERLIASLKRTCNLLKNVSDGKEHAQGFEALYLLDDLSSIVKQIDRPLNYEDVNQLHNNYPGEEFIKNSMIFALREKDKEIEELKTEISGCRKEYDRLKDEHVKAKVDIRRYYRGKIDVLEKEIVRLKGLFEFCWNESEKQYELEQSPIVDVGQLRTFDQWKKENNI